MQIGARRPPAARRTSSSSSSSSHAAEADVQRLVWSPDIHLALSLSPFSLYNTLVQIEIEIGIEIDLYSSREREMGSAIGSTAKTKEEIEMALSKVKDIVNSIAVLVFSKTYCGYCNQVKKLLSELGASYKVIELDMENDGSEMQSALAEWTGQRAVPNVFIGGKHVGGCDMVLQKHHRGELVPLLIDAGAISK